MIDRYNRKITYLRLSVTDRCNLRCRYCMPAEGICKKSHADMLTEEEMIQAVQAAASIGITKIRITGGEPLIKKNIFSICEKAAVVGGIEEVCMTTNGILLPQFAKQLKSAGVKRINISLDTLKPEKYAHITRGGSVEQVLSGLDAALDAGFEQVKINTVLIGGFNDDEISDIAELTRQYPVDVRFIELMPMHEYSAFGKEAYLSSQEVLTVFPEAVPQKADDSTAKLYRLPDAKGNIGLISPISNHFCGSCNRIRLTADGNLKPCLHTGAEYPIKGLSLEEMQEQFQKAVLAKPACHGELSVSSPSPAGRNMNQIGG